jgi:GTPase Era involved in 16S rRNA processing
MKNRLKPVLETNEQFISFRKRLTGLQYIVQSKHGLYHQHLKISDSPTQTLSQSHVFLLNKIDNFATNSDTQKHSYLEFEKIHRWSRKTMIFLKKKKISALGAQDLF